MEDGKGKGVFQRSVCSPIFIYYGDDLSLFRAESTSRVITDHRTWDAVGMIIDYENRGVAFCSF